ncbi:hypothetical protein AgCh_012840 [Apium graveolens]
MESAGNDHQRSREMSVPSLKHAKLEAACEDFSNVIDTSSRGTFYKGTLSTGIDIAVTSLTVESAKEWPENLEAQFRKKVGALLRNRSFEMVEALYTMNRVSGQAKTLMFVHISPEPDAVGEIISTLKFAERVATIELGAARVNKDTLDVKEDVLI